MKMCDLFVKTFIPLIYYRNGLGVYMYDHLSVCPNVFFSPKLLNSVSHIFQMLGTIDPDVCVFRFNVKHACTQKKDGYSVIKLFVFHQIHFLFVSFIERNNDIFSTKINMLTCMFPRSFSSSRPGKWYRNFVTLTSGVVIVGLLFQAVTKSTFC